MPARPPLSRLAAGGVIGFALRWPEVDHKVLWISGDTVPYKGVREVATRLDVDTAMVHLDGLRFPITGPIRYSLTGGEAVELLRLINALLAVPVHYEGWSHFREPRNALDNAFTDAPPSLRDRIVWLAGGVPLTLAHA